MEVPGMKSWADWIRRDAWMKENGVTEHHRKVDLPKDQWHTCQICDGTGSYYMSGDLHKSGGIVPCSCHNGIRKDKIEKYYRVKAKSEQRT